MEGVGGGRRRGDGSGPRTEFHVAHTGPEEEVLGQGGVGYREAGKDDAK